MPRTKKVVEPEITELQDLPELDTVKAPTQSIEKLVSGVKYYVMHERGEYKVYEKRGDGGILIQTEPTKEKASKLFNQLESFALRYRAMESGIEIAGR